METYNQTVASDTNLFELQINYENTGYLSETAKWAKFMSIVGFILIGLGLLAFITQLFTGFSGTLAYYTPLWQRALVPVILIVILVLYFFPTYYMYNFSNQMQSALRNNDQGYLNSAFGNLKSCFKFFGILTMIVVSIYVLFILFFIIGYITR